MNYNFDIIKNEFFVIVEKLYIWWLVGLLNGYFDDVVRVKNYRGYGGKI